MLSDNIVRKCVNTQLEKKNCFDPSLDPANNVYAKMAFIRSSIRIQRRYCMEMFQIGIRKGLIHIKPIIAEKVSSIITLP
jgi:hypothetical protein